MADPVELPVPPSANALWRVVRTRRGKASVTLARHYRAWLDEAILKLRLGMAVARAYPVAVRVTVLRGKGWTPGRDADNCLKAVSDALVKAQRIADDDEHHVTEFVIRFGPAAATACVLVTVEPVVPEPEGVGP